MQNKVCTKCGIDKPINEYYLAYGTTYRGDCKECVCKIRKTPEQQFKHGLKYKYGITVEQYNDMLEAQENSCSICLREFTRSPHVDHCHTEGHVRGLLCQSCNVALGHFRDDTETLQRAIDYLSC